MSYRDELTAATARRDAARRARSRLIEESPEAMELRRRLRALTDENDRLGALAADLRSRAHGRYAGAAGLVMLSTALMAIAFAVVLRVMG